MIEYHRMTAERQVEQLKERNEAVPYFTFDAVVVLGRGIWKHSETGNWAPTGLLEEGSGRFKAHTGIAPSGELDPNRWGADIVIGGANANVLACRHILQDWPAYGKELPYVIFAAGRPKYLENAPEDISEGSVLQSKLLKTIKLKRGIESPPMELQDKNTSTYDDVRESLKSCASRGAKNVAIITIRPHVHRVWQFANKVMNENPEITDNLENVYFIDSWALLGQKDARYAKIFKDIEGTRAYRRTQRLEKGGRRALRNNITSTQKIV